MTVIYTPANKNEKLPEGFKDKASIVSAVLQQKELEPGIYLRTETGEIKSATYSNILTYENMSEIFVDYKKEDVLSDKFSKPLKWPNIDFVYDSQLQAVFAEKGRYVLKFIHDVREGSDLCLHYYLREEDSEYRVAGYLNHLKVKDGGKRRVENFGMDLLQNWEDLGTSELPNDVYLKLTAIAIIGMPLIFSKWGFSDREINLEDMPAMTAVLPTKAKDYRLGIKGENPSVYKIYIDSSSRAKSDVIDA